MVDTTDIEKKSLEAHVELCAERYRYLENKLETVESTVRNVDSTVVDIRNMMDGIVNKRNDQLIKWGTAIIGVLVGTIGYLLLNYVIK
jgi:prephenate dehydratase